MSEIPAARSILITGASGLIGRRVVSELAAARDEAKAGTGIESIVAFDLRDVPAKQRHAGVEYRSGDIRAPDLENELRRHAVDTVVHLAAVVTPGSNSSRELEYSIDVLGTENVLGCSLRASVRQLIYTSSGAAYGYHADNPQPLRESDPLRGNEEFAYSHHKRLAEEILAKAREQHPELAQLIFRPGTILGELVNNPITAIFDRPLVIGVRGSESPFVLIWDEDVARCIVKGIRERREGIYNLTGDGVITMRRIARLIGKPYVALPAWLLQVGLRLGKTLGLTSLGPEQVRFLRYRPVLSNQRLKSEFGFNPTYSSGECFEHYQVTHFGS